VGKMEHGLGRIPSLSPSPAILLRFVRLGDPIRSIPRVPVFPLASGASRCCDSGPLLGPPGLLPCFAIRRRAPFRQVPSGGADSDLRPHPLCF
jgi:hypothetical protein